mmetsp:Transcript_47372/g.148092  ORF Transcript_47372/g.148092 Transcript_47372/m.148092 type:complete len:281 (-) Transcript_47372:572-1414(-)
MAGRPRKVPALDLLQRPRAGRRRKDVQVQGQLHRPAAGVREVVRRRDPLRVRRRGRRDPQRELRHDHRRPLHPLAHRRARVGARRARGQRQGRVDAAGGRRRHVARRVVRKRDEPARARRDGGLREHAVPRRAQACVVRDAGGSRPLPLRLRRVGARRRADAAVGRVAGSADGADHAALVRGGLVGRARQGGLRGPRVVADADGADRRGRVRGRRVPLQGVERHRHRHGQPREEGGQGQGQGRQAGRRRGGAKAQPGAPVRRAQVPALEGASARAAAEPL